MADPIRISTHPDFKALVDRLLGLHGDGIVLSLQTATNGQVSVGTKGQFGSLEEFRKYLEKSGLPFESLAQDGNKYVMRKGQITAEFYRFDTGVIE